MKKILMKIWPVLLWTGLVVYIFAPVLGAYIFLPSPDSPPLPNYFHFNYTSDLLAGATTWAPQDLLFYLLPPSIYSDFTYQLDTVLITIGFAYFLTAFGIPTLAALFGGGAFAFMGYSFTLFSAGHRGFFFMTLYVVFLFAFLARALAGRGLAYYILAAICAAWAMRAQADFAAVYFGLAAVYAIVHIIWQILDNRKANSTEEKRTPYIKQTIIGIVLAIAVFAITAAPTVYHTLTSTLAHRKAQIESSTPTPAVSQTPSSSNAKADDEDAKWIFATNWSLPPNEVLEFIAPAVFGRQSGDPDLPYWGRLGQAWKWEETRQGFINFRQHLVYLGAIPVALALFALFWIFFKESRKKTALRRETIFWAIIALTALILAFGRYTPLYKLFYSLPYMSYLRAPVKFMRLVEFAVAAMASFGLAQLVASEAQAKLRKGYTYTIAAIVGILIIGAIAVNVAPNSFLSRLNDLGGSQLIPMMAKNTCNALVHAIIGFGAVAAISFYAIKHKLNLHVATVILAIILAVDIAIVSRPFVVGQDREYEYSKDKNPIITTMAKIPAPRITSFIQDQNYAQAFTKAVQCQGYGLLPRNDLNHTQFLSKLPEIEGITRMMELSGSHLVLAPISMAQHLPRNRVTPLTFFKLAPPPALFSATSRPVQNGYMLARLNNPLPRAKLYTKWESITDSDFLSGVARVMANNNDTLAIGKNIPCGGTGTPGTVEILKIQNHNSSKSIYKTKTDSEQILSLTRGFSKDTVVLIDGKRVEQFIGGYSNTAILIPAGEHKIEVSSRERKLPVAIASAVILALSLGLLSYILGRDFVALYRS